MIVVKRPEDFYYVRVDFSLKKLEIIINNDNKVKKVEEGIRSILSDITMDFNLREGGYKLNFDIDNFKVDLFRNYYELGKNE